MLKMFPFTKSCKNPKNSCRNPTLNPLKKSKIKENKLRIKPQKRVHTK